ncbi:hypothetical protein AVEN_159778-1 [Araneus ventricosus]|uniref:Uncharacterized protein n=1 Tax=Araneus ventricosus TaxID=182803 RepID=A0A4Y2DAU1_ARAVE|nr:hypothetical protein AVEN_159778-1 [Araneus ventricosus]
MPKFKKKPEGEGRGQWCHEAFNCKGDSGCLVVMSRSRDRMAQGPKPDSTEAAPYMRPVAHYIILNVQMPSRRRDMEAWGGACQLRCRPCYLTVAQNYETHSKMALVLLQR